MTTARRIVRCGAEFRGGGRFRARAVLALAVALALIAGCGHRAPRSELAAKADAAWDLFRSNPATNPYENFIRANANAAREHGEPNDAAGVEFQVRALEAMSLQAERTKDAGLALDVVQRISEIEGHDLVGVYEEVDPGARERFAAAKARATRLTE